MHPYIYQLTVEAMELEKQRHYDNQRWLQDLPKNPTYFQMLRRVLSVRLMTALRIFGRTIKQKRGQYVETVPTLQPGCELPSTRAS